VRETGYGDWITALRHKAARHNPLFLQLGAAREPARRALPDAGLAVLALKDYMARQDDCTEAVLVIDKVEQLTSASSDMTIGELREKVFKHIDLGNQLILLSRAPRAAFPAVPGSSLLDDATFVHGPHEDMSDHAQWPSCRMDGAVADEVLPAALRELGPEVWGSLDRVIFDCLLLGEEALSVFTARELEALEGAGVISLGEAGRSWNFPRHLSPLKEALADVLAAEVKPQSQLAEVSRGLWEMERLIRRAIRARAVAAWGTAWRTQCLQEGLRDEVLRRATEATYIGANSIKLIRDPLEWLTLGELLDLKSRNEIGNLGLGPTHWRKFGEQIAPIRNRLAHMRTLHPGDATDVVKWLRVLELKLSSN
jgi:hypothetical protein